jgi:membrane associated rhomboid family serine protease
VKKHPVATYVLVGAAFLVFSVGYFAPGFRMALVFWAKPFLWPQALYTALTYSFVHMAPMHLVYNLVAIVVFVPAAEKRLGSFGFLALYLATSAFIAALSALLTLVIPVQFGFLYGATGCVLMASLIFAAFEPVVDFQALQSLRIRSSWLILAFGAVSFLWILFDKTAGFFQLFHILGYLAAGLFLLARFRLNVFKVLFGRNR